jgi:hypothetical protein
MFGSKNDFFLQDSARLADRRDQLIFLLNNIWGRNYLVTKLYLEAYDFFCAEQIEFDGATIVKDLKSIPNLDIHAMLHDYLYVKYNVSVNVKYKWYADLIYAKEMERMGSTYSTWSRFIGLTLFGGLFYTNNVFSGKRMSPEQKTEMSKMVVF